MHTATQQPAAGPTGAQSTHHSDSPHLHSATRDLLRQQSTDSATSIDSFPPHTSTPHRRSSVFFEEGLKGDDAIVDARIRRIGRPSLRVRFRSKVDIREPEEVDEPFYQPAQKPDGLPTLLLTAPRIMFFTLLLAVLIPSLGHSPFLKAGISPIGAEAGPIKVPLEEQRKAVPTIEKRQNSDTDICKRWSGQSAVVNGTMYYYGGRKSTSADQTSDTWTNDFLSLDLTKSWQISSPSMTGLPQPSGVPEVSLGYLWNSFDTLYLYGGQFSDSPVESPAPFSVWQYDIGASRWSELDNTETAGGENAQPSGQSVQRAAEGAGIAIPQLGRGYYFGGHLDGYTVEGWSQSIPRQYLTSLLEFTMPGYSNQAVNDGNTAGSGGLFRNITEGGVQGSAGFPERADGTLVYVPGYGEQGVLIGLAGGNNATFTQLNIIDVYDIATSSWYRQATSGTSPQVRVNPCAVVASAADGTSTQLYMFGGQNLIPAGEQEQYDDMWILSIPSFTWIEVDMSDQSVPPARAGHMCAAWNSQMVVWGGYVGQDLSCDSPGIYVFNLSSLAWQNEYRALSDGEDHLNRQTSQDDDSSALGGSFGYAVPGKVQEVIGGNAVGSATITEPVQTPTSGPMATGSPITYTVTGSDGSVVTETSTPGASDHGSSNSGGSSNAGAIAGGVIAGVLAIVALYLGYCVYVYRKQLAVYKNHVAMAQREHLAGDGGRAFLAVPPSVGKSSKEKSQSSSDPGRSSDERSWRRELGASNPYRNAHDDARSSTDDVQLAQEPSFVGILLNPRRSLRVVNRD